MEGYGFCGLNSEFLVIQLVASNLSKQFPSYNLHLHPLLTSLSLHLHVLFVIVLVPLEFLFIYIVSLNISCYQPVHKQNK